MEHHDIRRDLLGLIREYDCGLTVSRLRSEAQGRFDIEGPLQPHLANLIADGTIEKVRDPDNNQLMYRPVRKARK